jgi:hypothetical protein
MEQGSDMVGDIADLNQDDEYPVLPIPAVTVNIDGPVQTHNVPSVSGGSRSFAVAALDPAKRVVNEDPRRRILRIIATQAFFVGEDANQVQSRYSGQWPANLVCEITHMEAVYVSLLVDGTVTVMSENWAD